MNAYRSYMDRAELSAEGHKKLMRALERPPARRGSHAARWGLAAACLALACLAGWGFAQGRIGRWSGVTPPPVAGVTPTPTAAPTVQPSAGDPYVLSISGGDVELPGLRRVRYGGGSEMAASIAFPDGWFEEVLTREELLYLLGGPGAERAPAALLWGDYDVTGKAIYDGEGNLWRTVLTGVSRTDGRNSFTLTARPGAIPEDCLVDPKQASTEINGIQVYGSNRGRYGWDDSGAMGYIYKITLLAGEAGLRLEVYNMDEGRARELANAGANWFATAEQALWLDQTVPGEIPEWRSEELTLTEARTEELGRYLPESVPAGYSFEWAWRELGQGRDWLSARWNRGLREIEVTVTREGYSTEDPIPRGDLTAEAVLARLEYVDSDAGDAPGWRGRFAVRYPDGVTAEYAVKGLSEEQAAALAN
ncbi:conserved hypothetical protein [uncultured Eubacteriales bacterium]|uniref:Uncharacterized protein n=1 Tax=uncultured Eubacteriales bacterium TaxID=172733 RepID=A0A212IZ20_9FIRM|nr:conserved hypothetical protein [uncultured Eubacteriales bacterium]